MATVEVDKCFNIKLSEEEAKALYRLLSSSDLYSRRGSIHSWTVEEDNLIDNIEIALEQIGVDYES